MQTLLYHLGLDDGLSVYLIPRGMLVVIVVSLVAAILPWERTRKKLVWALLGTWIGFFVLVYLGDFCRVQFSTGVWYNSYDVPRLFIAFPVWFAVGTAIPWACYWVRRRFDARQGRSNVDPGILARPGFPVIPPKAVRRGDNGEKTVP